MGIMKQPHKLVMCSGTEACTKPTPSHYLRLIFDVRLHTSKKNDFKTTYDAFRTPLLLVTNFVPP